MRKMILLINDVDKPAVHRKKEKTTDHLHHKQSKAPLDSDFKLGGVLLTIRDRYLLGKECQKPPH